MVEQLELQEEPLLPDHHLNLKRLLLQHDHCHSSNLQQQPQGQRVDAVQKLDDVLKEAVLQESLRKTQKE